MNRLRGADGDSAVQLSDLFVFLGYFSICLFAGGTTYRMSFNDTFQFAVKAPRDPVATATDFVVSVLWDGFYGPFAFVFVLGLAFLFFVCRFVWRLWFSFLVLAVSLCAVFVACALVGDIAGERDARKLIAIDQTKQPIITFKDTVALQRFNDGNYRLLAQSAEYLYIFEPQIEGSQNEISVIKKKNIGNFEVTIE